MNLPRMVILVTITVDCTAAYILHQSNYITKRPSADYPISRAILE